MIQLIINREFGNKIIKRYTNIIFGVPREADILLFHPYSSSLMPEISPKAFLKQIYQENHFLKNQFHFNLFLKLNFMLNTPDMSGDVFQDHYFINNQPQNIPSSKPANYWLSSKYTEQKYMVTKLFQTINPSILSQQKLHFVQTSDKIKHSPIHNLKQKSNKKQFRIINPIQKQYLSSAWEIQNDLLSVNKEDQYFPFKIDSDSQPLVLFITKYDLQKQQFYQINERQEVVLNNILLRKNIIYHNPFLLQRSTIQQKNKSQIYHPTGNTDLFLLSNLSTKSPMNNRPQFNHCEFPNSNLASYTTLTNTLNRLRFVQAYTKLFLKNIISATKFRIQQISEHRYVIIPCETWNIQKALYSGQEKMLQVENLYIATDYRSKQVILHQKPLLIQEHVKTKHQLDSRHTIIQSNPLTNKEQRQIIRSKLTLASITTKNIPRKLQFVRKRNISDHLLTRFTFQCSNEYLQLRNEIFQVVGSYPISTKTNNIHKRIQFIYGSIQPNYNQTNRLLSLIQVNQLTNKEPYLFSSVSVTLAELPTKRISSISQDNDYSRKHKENIQLLKSYPFNSTAITNRLKKTRFIYGSDKTNYKPTDRLLPFVTVNQSRHKEQNHVLKSNVTLVIFSTKGVLQNPQFIDEINKTSYPLINFISQDNNEFLRKKYKEVFQDLNSYSFNSIANTNRLKETRFIYGSDKTNYKPTDRLLPFVTVNQSRHKEQNHVLKSNVTLVIFSTKGVLQNPQFIDEINKTSYPLINFISQDNNEFLRKKYKEVFQGLNSYSFSSIAITNKLKKAQSIYESDKLNYKPTNRLFSFFQLDPQRHKVQNHILKSNVTLVIFSTKGVLRYPQFIDKINKANCPLINFISQDNIVFLQKKYKEIFQVINSHSTANTNRLKKTRFIYGSDKPNYKPTDRLLPFVTVNQARYKEQNHILKNVILAIFSTKGVLQNPHIIDEINKTNYPLINLISQDNIDFLQKKHKDVFRIIDSHLFSSIAIANKFKKARSIYGIDKPNYKPTNRLLPFDTANQARHKEQNNSLKSNVNWVIFSTKDVLQNPQFIDRINKTNYSFIESHSVSLITIANRIYGSDKPNYKPTDRLLPFVKVNQARYKEQDHVLKSNVALVIFPTKDVLQGSQCINKINKTNYPLINTISHDNNNFLRKKYKEVFLVVNSHSFSSIAVTNKLKKAQSIYESDKLNYKPTNRLLPFVTVNQARYREQNHVLKSNVTLAIFTTKGVLQNPQFIDKTNKTNYPLINFITQDNIDFLRKKYKEVFLVVDSHSFSSIAVTNKLKKAQSIYESDKPNYEPTSRLLPFVMVNQARHKEQNHVLKSSDILVIFPTKDALQKPQSIDKISKINYLPENIAHLQIYKKTFQIPFSSIANINVHKKIQYVDESDKSNFKLTNRLLPLVQADLLMSKDYYNISYSKIALILIPAKTFQSPLFIPKSVYSLISVISQNNDVCLQSHNVTNQVLNSFLSFRLNTIRSFIGQLEHKYYLINKERYNTLNSYKYSKSIPKKHILQNLQYTIRDDKIKFNLINLLCNKSLKTILNKTPNNVQVKINLCRFQSAKTGDSLGYSHTFFNTHLKGQNLVTVVIPTHDGFPINSSKNIYSNLLLFYNNGLSKFSQYQFSQNSNKALVINEDQWQYARQKMQASNIVLTRMATSRIPLTQYIVSKLIFSKNFQKYLHLMQSRKYLKSINQRLSNEQLEIQNKNMTLNILPAKEDWAEYSLSKHYSLLNHKNYLQREERLKNIGDNNEKAVNVSDSSDIAIATMIWKKSNLNTTYFVHLQPQKSNLKSVKSDIDRRRQSLTRESNNTESRDINMTHKIQEVEYLPPLPLLKLRTDLPHNEKLSSPPTDIEHIKQVKTTTIDKGYRTTEIIKNELKRDTDQGKLNNSEIERITDRIYGKLEQRLRTERGRRGMN